MKLTKFISLLFFLQISVWSLAQIDWSKPVLQIDEKDGLPSTYIKDFVEDEYGFIWILTFSGLCRFDGDHLYVVRDTLLPIEGFVDIEYDAKRKKLWIGTVIGLFAYDLPTDKVLDYRTEGISASNPITSIALGAKETLWIGTYNHLAKLDLKTDSVSIISLKLNHPKIADRSFNEIKDVLQDPKNDDRVWLTSEGGILFFIPSESRAVYANNLVGNIDNLLFTDLFSDPKSEYIYFGRGRPTEKESAYNYLAYDPEKDRAAHTISLNGDWNNRKISALKESLILLSNSSGLAIYDEKKQEIIKNYLNNPNSNQIFKVDFVDSKSNVWVATHEDIKMFPTIETNGKNYYYESEYPNWYHIVTGIYYDAPKEAVYMPVMGGEGLYKFDLANKEWITYPFLDKEGNLAKTDFTAVTRTNEGIQIMGNQGIYTINEEGNIELGDFKIEGHSGYMNSFFDSRNNVWTINNKGVVKIDLKTKAATILTDDVHFCPNYTGDAFFFEDSQLNVWIGGFCDGFDKYDSETGTLHSFSLKGLSEATSITTIDEKNGEIWAQGDNGDIFIVSIELSDKGITKVVPLKQKIEDGSIKLFGANTFDADFFTDGQFDILGRFWTLSRLGLYRYDQAAEEIELFDESVGMGYNDADMNVFVGGNMIRLEDGRMLFTSRKGLCIFDPLEITNDRTLPKPYIRAFTVNNEEITVDSSSIFKNSYQFKSYQNFIGFDFSALDYVNPDNVKYRYKLDGVDEQWKNPGDKKYVGYTQLKGGDYTFHLQASHNGDIWSTEMTPIHVHIEKIWYTKDWARGLFIASSIFFIVTIYFNRLKRAIEKEQMRIQFEKDLAELKMQALTAQMNPHFIFNSLNSIDYYIIKNDTRNASKYLNRFSRLMRLILKNSRSNYVRLKDDLEALKLYLEIEALRFNHEFDFEIKLNENIDPDYVRIPPMLVQPYVENAIWHGLLHQKENGKITVTYELDEAKEMLKCTVHDNGIGRKKSMELKAQNVSNRERKSFGMNITKDKLEALKYLHGIEAEVKVIDLYDENENGIGTKVELIFPV